MLFVGPTFRSLYSPFPSTPYLHPRVQLQFSFLLGTDTYQDLRRGKWRKSEDLLKMVSVVVVDRESLVAESELLAL